MYTLNDCIKMAITECERTGMRQTILYCVGVSNYPELRERAYNYIESVLLDEGTDNEINILDSTFLPAGWLAIGEVKREAGKVDNPLNPPCFKLFGLADPGEIPK